MWITALLLSISISHSACKKQTTITEEAPVIVKDTGIHILFVGNSLTYTNELPTLVSRIGKQRGVPIVTTMVAYPNYALEDHWNDGQIQKMIAKEKYQFVVVQQGPSSQADGRVMLLDYGARLKELCDKHKAKLAFFMVWPAYSNMHTFDGVIKNYSDAATETNSILCPVGRMWRSHFASTGDYSYYGPDMFHPSAYGSESAAQIIYESLFR